MDKTTPFTQSHAQALDREDKLASLRSEFLFPKAPDGGEALYFTGNSLGLQPKKARTYILEELEDWERLGVEGHIHARHPWLPYHEFVRDAAARVVGAKPIEVVTMNTLSVNLHLMMVSFYRPTQNRFKILIEENAFPSDQYAVASQARFHGFDPKNAIIHAKQGELLETLEREGASIALVLVGGVNYLTGRAFNMAELARIGHKQGCQVGLDLAHAAGNLELKLHDWDIDFAVWCNYKYLNSGPGAIAGAFVHERHAKFAGPRFEGWWGHDKTTRFKMGPDFHAIEGAEGWQLSNPPIFQLAALRASLELFDRATLPHLRQKSLKLTAFLEQGLKQLPPGVLEIMTPSNPEERGCQLSLKFTQDPRGFQERLTQGGVICDFREPNIIRAAPTPLYNRFEDVFKFVQIVEAYAK